MSEPLSGQATPPPPNHLVWAVLSTVFCCLPFGVVSIVFAARVNSRWAAGDVAGARDAARKAQLWAIGAAVAFFVTGMVYVLAALAYYVTAGSTTTGS